MRNNRSLYLLLGTNLGDRHNNLNVAKTELDAYFHQNGEVSSFYETLAWGKTDQPDFLNAAVVYNTHIQANQILMALQNIEIFLGRERIEKWGPRLIDIDILFYGDEILNSTDLQIPHAEIQNRRFALVPMHQLNSQFIHPVYNKTIAQLLAICPDLLQVKELKVLENSI